MTEPDDRLIEMFDKALRMEEKGRAYYRKAVETVENDVGREIFRMLMNDESVHMERIKKIYDSVTRGEGVTEEWKQVEITHGDLLDMFRKMASEHGQDIKAGTSDLEALEVGLDFEATAVDFYRGHLEGAADPKEREFIEAMIAEERSHYAALSDMKYYLTDPEGWFSEKEHWSLDGA